MGTNPNNLVGTNGAYGGRTSVNALNDVLSAFSGAGIVSGWVCEPDSGMTIKFGGDGSNRDVAIAQDPIGNRTTINNREGDPVPVEIASASATQNRMDCVVAYVNSPASVSTTTLDNPEAVGIIDVQGGNSTPPDDSAIRAAITADGGTGTVAYYVILATITIPAGTTTITSGEIEQGQAAMTKILANSISESMLQDESVTEDKIADNAVTSSALATGSVTSTKLATNAVTNAKIANSSIKAQNIDNTSLAPAEILWEQIGSGSGNTTFNQIDIPFASLIWDSANSRTKYHKVVLEMVAESASTPGSGNSHLIALVPSGLTLNTFQVGTEAWNNAGEFIRRNGSEIVAFKFIGGNSVSIHAEFYLPIKNNFVPFTVDSFSGTETNSGIQRFVGRINDNASRVATLRIKTNNEGSFTLQNYYKIRLFGYRKETY